VFYVALEGKSNTTYNRENPWIVNTIVKLSNGDFVDMFEVALYVREIKEHGIVVFRFKRLRGNPISFARIWDAAEHCLVKLMGSIFLDRLENSFGSEREEIR